MKADSTHPQAATITRIRIVDAADYVIWRKTLGRRAQRRRADGDESGTIDARRLRLLESPFRQRRTRGGEIIMTGSSTLTTNGAVIGRRTKGLLSVGPIAVVDS